MSADEQDGSATSLSQEPATNAVGDKTDTVTGVRLELHENRGEPTSISYSSKNTTVTTTSNQLSTTTFGLSDIWGFLKRFVTADHSFAVNVRVTTFDVILFGVGYVACAYVGKHYWPWLDE
jgi:hypothetical protein